MSPLSVWTQSVAYWHGWSPWTVIVVQLIMCLVVAFEAVPSSHFLSQSHIRTLLWLWSRYHFIHSVPGFNAAVLLSCVKLKISDSSWASVTSYSWRCDSRHVLIPLYIYVLSSGFYNRTFSSHLLLIAVHKAKANISSRNQSVTCRFTSNATAATLDLFTSCNFTLNANVLILGTSVTRYCVRDTNI